MVEQLDTETFEDYEKAGLHGDGTLHSRQSIGGIFLRQRSPRHGFIRARSVKSLANGRNWIGQMNIGRAILHS